MSGATFEPQPERTAREYEAYGRAVVAVRRLGVSGLSVLMTRWGFDFMGRDTSAADRAFARGWFWLAARHASLTAALLTLLYQWLARASGRGHPWIVFAVAAVIFWAYRSLYMRGTEDFDMLREAYIERIAARNIERLSHGLSALERIDPTED